MEANNPEHNTKPARLNMGESNNVNCTKYNCSLCPYAFPYS